MNNIVYATRGFIIKLMNYTIHPRVSLFTLYLLFSFTKQNTLFQKNYAFKTSIEIHRKN